MATFKWRNGEVPSGMKVTQVYGVAFSSDGRVLLMVKDKGNRKEYSLIGGTPEDFDGGIVATLRREFFEEVNVTIKQPILLGYQEVDEENGKEPYAQVRMATLIDEIGVSRPDPDNGQTYGRLLVSPDRAIELLNWGEVGRCQVTVAVQIAREKFGLKEFSEKEEVVSEKGIARRR